MTEQKKVKKDYIIVNHLDHTGKVEKSFKQYLPDNNLQSAHDLGEANSRGKVGSL